MDWLRSAWRFGRRENPPRARGVRGAGEAIPLVSYHELLRHSVALAEVVQGQFEAVYGIPRSGMLPASIVATELNLPLGVAGGANRSVWHGERLEVHPGDARDGPALLVDDSVSSGRTMKQAEKELLEIGVTSVVRCAVYVRPDMKSFLHYHAVPLQTPRLFRWNLFNHEFTPHIMCDLDGVFAADPAVFDDDGPAYQAEIASARLLRRPGRPVHSICTNRIERWRGLTMKWLQDNRIDTPRVFMSPHETAEDRRREGNYGVRKGEIYVESDAILFVESSDAQARRIHEVSGKPVLSLETETFHR